jgi:hypothetical protein
MCIVIKHIIIKYIANNNRQLCEWNYTYKIQSFGILQIITQKATAPQNIMRLAVNVLL